jgi:hypothetical protein
MRSNLLCIQTFEIRIDLQTTLRRTVAMTGDTVALFVARQLYWRPSSLIVGLIVSDPVVLDNLLAV